MSWWDFSPRGGWGVGELAEEANVLSKARRPETGAHSATATLLPALVLSAALEGAGKPGFGTQEMKRGLGKVKTLDQVTQLARGMTKIET